MDATAYQTKWISLRFFPNGQVRLWSDGWVRCGNYTRAEANALLSHLTQAAWSLVGCIEQDRSCGVSEAMDLYFRREVEEPAGQDQAAEEHNL